MQCWLLLPYVLLLLTDTTLLSAQPATSNFMEYLPVSEEIRTSLDAHVDELTLLIDLCEKNKCQHGIGVAEFPWLPNFLIKYDVIRRINGAAQLDECIKKYSLDLLAVPQKYIYHIKGRAETTSKHNYLVVVPKVVRQKPVPLGSTHIKQLCTLMEHTDFYDPWKDNIFFTGANMLTIIDTGIDVQKGPFSFNLKNFLRGLEMLVGSFDIEEKAFADLIEHVHDLMHREPWDSKEYTWFEEKLAELPIIRAERLKENS